MTNFFSTFPELRDDVAQVHYRSDSEEKGRSCSHLLYLWQKQYTGDPADVKPVFFHWVATQQFHLWCLWRNNQVSVTVYKPLLVRYLFPFYNQRPFTVSARFTNI